MSSIRRLCWLDVAADAGNATVIVSLNVCHDDCVLHPQAPSAASQPVGIGGKMRRAIAPVLALTLLAAACGGESETSAEDTSTTTQAPTTTETSTSTTTTAAETTTIEGSGDDPSIAVGALVIVAINFDSGLVLIRNDGDTDYDLSGHWLCNRPTYTPLPDHVLAPGEVIEIDASKVALRPDSGELGLYTSGDFGSSADIIRYVQWGTDSHGRTSTAVAGGVWREGDFVDNQGGNLETSGSDPISAEDWTSS